MNKIEEKLWRAIEDAPSVSVEELKRADVPKMEEHDYITRQEESKPAPRLKRMGFAAVSICMCFFLIFSLQMKQRAAAIVDIDINPSIEITLNKKNKVIRMEAINEDGGNILEHLDYKDKDVDDVLYGMLDEMIRQGYLTKDKLENNILLSVEHPKREMAEELTIRLNSAVSRYLEKRRIPVRITDQHMNDDDKERKVAEEYGISMGKLTLIRKVMKEHENLKIGDLTKLSLRELVDLLDESRDKKPSKKKKSTADTEETSEESTHGSTAARRTDKTKKSPAQKSATTARRDRRKKATTEKAIRDDSDDDEDDDLEEEDDDADEDDDQEEDD